MEKISIITVNLNNKTGLEKTIKSVADQTKKPFEFIVVDGRSDDGSAELLSGKPGVITKWISEKDKGIYDGMNKGIDLASGEYLLFLNSGDEFADKEVLKDMEPLFENADIVYGDLLTIESDGKKEHHKSFSEANVYNLMISTIWHPCAFISKKLFLQHGKYNTEFKIAGDYEFFVRTILAGGATSKYVERTIAQFDKSGISSMPENIHLMDEERKRAWTSNFSDPMIDFFERGVKFSRSRELRVGKLVSRFLPG